MTALSPSDLESVTGGMRVPPTTGPGIPGPGLPSPLPWPGPQPKPLPFPQPMPSPNPYPITAQHK